MFKITCEKCKSETIIRNDINSNDNISVDSDTTGCFVFITCNICKNEVVTDK